MNSRLHRQNAGWTLLELIAVVAVVAVLAGIVLPVMVRHTDRLVADQEVATLSSYASGLQQYILSNRKIPDHTTWYLAIATNMGASANDVLYNVRQQSHAQQRVFLIDPKFQIGTGSSPALPYVQTNALSGSAGRPILPVSPRVMIVSSLGKSLPAGVVSGVFGTTANGYFDDLWNSTDATVPSDTAWIGWTGSPADIIVQRINLAPLFVHLVLGNYNSANQGYYTVDPGSGTPIPVTYVDGYFIRSTVLALFNSSSAGSLDTQLVLNRDSSFVFEQGVWRNNLLAPAGGGIAAVGDLVQQFMDATPNLNAKNPTTNLQQIMIVTNMLSYMSNYVAWYAASPTFKQNVPQYNTLVSLHDSMVASLSGIFLGTNQPANPAACP